MTWPRVPLKDVAPAESSCIQFQPEEKVWLLTLDPASVSANHEDAPCSPLCTSAT